jgi:predicted TPR repeat methyltransferase
MTDTGPLFVSSGDLIADRRYKWALDHAARGDFAGAADILVQTVELAPGFATAWFALGAIRDQLSNRAGAVAAFEKVRDLDSEDYHGARLQLARLGAGNPTPAMTETYVRRLFDQYAERYDVSLIEHLAYRGPVLLREAVESVLRVDGRPMHFNSMLDLGCGTGLAGAAFQPFVDRCVGVDLSPAMIAQADAKGVYDRLVKADVGHFLAREAADGVKYHLVVAADVFVYINDLRQILAAIARVLRPEGVLAFTVETHRGGGVKLRPTLRYAHGHEVRALLGAAALTASHFGTTPVRYERGVPVDSHVIVAQPSTAKKPPASSGA